MSAIAIGVTWFFIVVGAGTTFNFVYDLIEDGIEKRKRNKMGGVVRVNDDLEFRCKVAALDKRIDSTEKRIKALQDEMELDGYMKQIREDFEKVKKELGVDEDKD